MHKGEDSVASKMGIRRRAFLGGVAALGVMHVFQTTRKPNYADGWLSGTPASSFNSRGKRQITAEAKGKKCQIEQRLSALSGLATRFQMQDLISAAPTATRVEGCASQVLH
jgi:hypothetical protein